MSTLAFAPFAPVHTSAACTENDCIEEFSIFINVTASAEDAAALGATGHS